MRANLIWHEGAELTLLSSALPSVYWSFSERTMYEISGEKSRDFTCRICPRDLKLDWEIGARPTLNLKDELSAPFTPMPL